MTPNMPVEPFRLSDTFIDGYRRRKPPFGFNGLGELVYVRTYSRLKADGKNERWFETVRRVVEGTYSMQKRWIMANSLGWSDRKAQRSAEEMYDRIFNMKFLPPGRGLWAMGSPLTEERGLQAALFNCGFLSTAAIKEEGADPFTTLMDMSMLGIGVGFDTLGAGTVTVQAPAPNDGVFIIGDNRESWVKSVGLVIDAYLTGSKLPEFDYSQIRPAGEPIRGFGGVAAGPEPLRDLHHQLVGVLEPLVGKPLTVRAIVDMMNLIGKCVVAGNVRRSAELALGPYTDEYLNLKDYRVNPERETYGWTSNNSVSARLGMDYTDAAKRIQLNGEPGFLWLENVHTNARMGDELDNDARVAGCNPCLTGDTLVAVADGRGPVAIEALATEGKDVPVYACDAEGKLIIRTMRHPRITGHEVPVFEVEIEGGHTFRATGNHKMRLSTGEYRAVSTLAPGDSLHAGYRALASIKDMFPNTNSRSQDYIWIRNDTRKTYQLEHRLIYESHFGPIPRGTGMVVHHKDYDAQNNCIDNLQLMSKREHDAHHARDMMGERNPYYKMSDAWRDRFHQAALDRASGDTNGHYSGITHAQLLDAGVALTTQLGRRFSSSEWQQHASAHKLPQHFSEWRRKEFGTVTEFSKYCAELAGVHEYAGLDPRTVRHYHDMVDQGYTARIVDGQVEVLRVDEYDGVEFWISSQQREHAFRSIANALAYRAQNSAMEQHRKQRQRAVFDERKREKEEAQQRVFTSLRMQLGREPKKSEWEQACKAEGLATRLGRPASSWKNYGEFSASAREFNHRVVAVRPAGTATVYNGTVDEVHNFYMGGWDTIGSNGKRKVVLLNNLQCGEIPLEDAEMCNIVESFPARHADLDDYKRTLKFAYLYSKTVTLSKSPWKKTNRVMLRNRRVGVSQSGIQQFIAERGIDTYREWCEVGYRTLQYYDGVYSDWLAIPKSKRLTTGKPSGTVSLLVGATPGIHWPEARYYIRRLRLAADSPLIEPLQRAGYPMEPAFGDELNTVVVEFPVSVGDEVRTVGDVPMWEQLAMGAFVARHWSDNMVSQTVSFDPVTEGPHIAAALNYYQYHLKSISFLPRVSKGAYRQMPYEAISRDAYDARVAALKPLRIGVLHEEGEQERFCTNDTCTI